MGPADGGGPGAAVGHPDEKGGGQPPQPEVRGRPQAGKLEKDQGCPKAPRKLPQGQSQRAGQSADPAAADRQLDDPDGGRHDGGGIEQAHPDASQYRQLVHFHTASQ